MANPQSDKVKEKTSFTEKKGSLGGTAVNHGEGNGTPLQYSCWKIPWTEEPGRLQSMGSLESDTTKRLHFHFSLSCIGEGNGNPLQCCLENPRDRKPGGGPSMGSHGVEHN